jgi:teichuronic acid biosynthesis glycosyltransferase TuaG
MENNKLVSIVIPMYNAENFILETINSILYQSHQVWELIIVDNASTDNSVEIVKSINDLRIKLIKLEVNSGGPAHPRNIGIDNANGEYVAFLDADDIWTSDKLTLQLEFMYKNNVNFSSTDRYNIDIDSKGSKYESKVRTFLKKIRTKESACDLMKVNFIATSSVIIEKKILMHFNETDEYMSVEDFALWLDMFMLDECKYKFLDKKMLKYRILEESATDRKIKHKQSIKTYLVVLSFILKYNKFNHLKCFYFIVFKKVLLSFFSKNN